MKNHFMAKKALSLVLTAGMILSVFASSPSFVYATEGEIDQNGIETPLDEMDNADAPLVTAIPGLSEKEEDTQVIQEGDPENTEENVSPDNVIENDEVPGKGDPENIPDDETPENISDDEVTDEQTPEKQVPADEDPEDSAPQENENADAGEDVNADKDQEQKQEIPDAPQDVTEPAADTQQPGPQQEQPVTQEPNAEDKTSQETEPEKTEPEKTEPKKTELENTTTTTEKKEIKAAEEKQKEEKQEEEKQEEKEEPVYTDGKLIAKGSDFEITLTYGADAKIPEDAVLSAVEILEQHDVYETCVDKAAEKVYEEDDAVEEKPVALPYARFFDITILSADGEVIEPAAEVKVIIDLKDDALQTEDVNFTAVHFVEEETRAAEEAPAADTEEPVVKTETVEKAQAELIAIEPENLGTSDADSVVEIAAESFSIYGVVYYYTVDFYYTSNDGDGEATTAEYHMNGGTEMMLSELFTKLGIDRDAAEVTDVDFTDDSLVTFTQEGNDWRIKSLKPFTTSEVLTITFEDGSSIVIGVEDAIVAQGTFGVNGGLRWSLEDDGTLTIVPTNGTSGSINKDGPNGQTGNHYTSKGQWPWNSRRSDIKKVVIKGTVTSWGNANLSYMFADCTALTEADLSGLDASKIRHVNSMFEGCTSLETINMPSTPFLKIDDAGNQNNLSNMFKNCSSLESIDLSVMRTDNAYLMRSMFEGCTSLTELDLSSFSNNGRIQEMVDMFKNCSSLEKIQLGGAGGEFKTRPSTSDGYNGGYQGQRMFDGCTSLKHLELTNCTLDGGRYGWDSIISAFGTAGFKDSIETIVFKDSTFPNERDVSYAFANCSNLTTVEMTVEMTGSDRVFPDAEYMTGMFMNSVTTPSGSDTPTIDVSGFGELSNIINMDGFVKGCTALETLNIDNLDNSHIAPKNNRHFVYEGDDVTQKTGADEYGRQLGIETCTALKTLSAKNSKVWMTYNHRGLPGAEYYNASDDVKPVYYFTDKAMTFESDAGPTETIDSDRDYIDLIIDRDGINNVHTYSPAVNPLPDAATNINIKDGDLNPHGPGFLAPGVYTLDGTRSDPEHAPMEDTYYRIAYMGEKPYTVEWPSDGIDGLVKVEDAYHNNVSINTAKMSWDTSGDKVIDCGSGIKIVYHDVAIDCNGKLHDVIVTIKKITFKDLDKIPYLSTEIGGVAYRDRVHDDNVNEGKVLEDSQEYYRPVLQATRNGITLQNYIRSGDSADPNNPGSGIQMLTGGSGTDIEFKIEIDKANDGTSFVFLARDLDVAYSQDWQYDSNGDACYDKLSVENVTYGQGGEGFILGEGVKANTVQFAEETGLYQSGNMVLTTGGDPKTPWSEFTVSGDAKGSTFTWTSGIGCTTFILENTKEQDVGKLIIQLQALKSLTGGKLEEGDFKFTLEKDGTTPNGAPEPEDTAGNPATFPQTRQNDAEGKVTFDAMVFRTSSENALIDGSDSFSYFPGTGPDGNTSGNGKHNSFVYSFKLKEVKPDPADPDIEYDETERSIKIEITTPENDGEMAKGIHGVVKVDGTEVANVWSGSRKDSETHKITLTTFKNSVKTNDVSVKKETIGNKTGSFDFLITFDKPKTEYDPSAEGVEGITEDTSATAAVSGSAWKFSLDNGKNIVFPNVPLGTTYSVKEIPSANGFELVSVDGDATKTTATNKVSVEKDDPNYKGEYDHTFLNRRTELVVKKTVSKGDKTKNFTFSANAEVSGLAANSTFSYGVIDASGQEAFDLGQADANGDASITFNRFQISDAKSAKLVVPLNAKVTVTEVDPGDYDVYVAEGTASKTEDDTITVTADTDGKEITFTNVGPLAYTEITVEKQIEKGDTSLKFDFTAEAEVSGLMPGKTFSYGWANDEGQEEYDEATADANGKATVTFKAFSLADDESVRLSVPQGAQVTITEAENDDYEVTVAEDGGTVEAARTITVSTVDKESTMVVFTNTSTKPVIPPTGDDAVSEDYKGKPQTGTPSFKVGQPDTPSGGINKIEKIVLLDGLGNEAPGNKIVVSGEGTYELDPATGTVTFTPEPEFVGKAKGVGVRAYDSNYEYGQSLDPKINCYVDVKYTPTVKVKVSYVDSLTGQTVQGPTDSYVKEGKDVTTTYETEDESKYGKEESKNHPNHIFDGWEQTVDPEDPSHYIRTAKYMPVYTITYDPNGGEGEMEDNTYRQDDPEKPIDKNRFTKPEHKFTGFYGYVTDPETGEETLIKDANGEPLLFDGTTDMNDYFKGVDDVWLPAGTTIRMEAQWEKGEEPEPEPEPEKDDEPEPEPDKPAPGPRYTLHISGTKTWIDEGYKSGKRPQAVIVRLYADGQEIAQRAVSFATGGTENSDIWTFDFGEHDMYKAGVPIRYTLTEDTLEGYTTQITSNYQKVEEVKGSRLTFSVVNTAGEKRSAARTTGDESRMLLWGLIAMAAVAGLILFVSKQRRRG